MELKFGGLTKYWRVATASGRKSHVTIYEPHRDGVIWTLCGRGVKFLVKPVQEEMTEVRGTECMNCLDALRARETEERASRERMRIFRNIPPKG
jgi:hypothetical protein